MHINSWQKKANSHRPFSYCIFVLFFLAVRSEIRKVEHMLILSLGISLFIVVAAVTALMVFICKRRREGRKVATMLEKYLVLRHRLCNRQFEQTMFSFRQKDGPKVCRSV